MSEHGVGAARPHARAAPWLSKPSIAVLVAVAVTLAGIALAHPDVPIVQDTLTLRPGVSVAYPMAIHYHRVVGRYRVQNARAHDVTFAILDEGDYRNLGEASGATRPVRRRLQADGGSFQHLVPCCLGTAYTPYRLLVRNDGKTPVSLDVRAWAVHDEFAVVVHRAEAGAAAAPAALFVVLLAATGRAMGALRARARRRAMPSAPVAGPVNPRAAYALRWSTALFLGACVAALALGTAGAARYGAGPVDGMVAIMADLPLPGGPFGSRGATMMGVLLVAWIATHGTWLGAVHLGAGAPTVRLGMAIGAVTLVAGAAMAWTYGAWMVPIGLAALLGLPVLVLAGVVRSAEAGWGRGAT